MPIPERLRLEHGRDGACSNAAHEAAKWQGAVLA